VTADPIVEPALNTFIRRSADWVVSRVIPLPPPTNRYRVVRGVRIPMRDSTELIADRFVPDISAAVGTVLIRSPYGRGYPQPQFYAQPLAARGFHVVVQSVRGTYGSSGVFDPAVNETTDGVDTIAWMRRQPWFTGPVATIGASYLGLTQWALLQDPPPELAAAVIVAAPHDISAVWATGSFALHDYLGWSDGMVRQGDRGPIMRKLSFLVRPSQFEDSVSMLPLGPAGRSVLGSGARWYESWLAHPDRQDPYWDSQRFTDALDRSRVPVLLVNGWQDVFLEQTVEQYRRLSQRNVDVAMTIGPWTHSRMLRRGARTFIPEALQWISTHLADVGETRRHPVRVFVNGHGWIERASWPPAVSNRVLYLGCGAELGEELPDTAGPPSSFTYDPADPTPTIGGRLLAPISGYRDDTALVERSDVATFTTEALTHDVYVLGSPVVELTHSADNPYVDLFVRLSQANADGESTNVADGYRRCTRREPSSPTQVDVELDAIAHRFPAGSRIRVIIGGGSHPRFARNPGTGEEIATAVRLVAVKHFVHHGAGGLSRLILPASDDLPPGP
jgi:putative CocE/NonD family hydrolase